MTTQNQVATIEQTDERQQFLALVERLSANKDVDVSKINAILDMQERVMNKQAEISFNQALSRLSGKLAEVRIVRTHGVSYKDVEAFKFAPYEVIDQAIRPLYTSEGFSLSFNSETREGGGAIITGTLSHIDGHSRKASLPLALDISGGKNNIQAMGSTISYGKRYTMGMLLNIVTVGEDDDALSAFEKITTDQAVEIDLLISEVKADRPRFLKFMGVSDVRDILAKNYSTAVTQLNAKKVKK